MQIVDISQFEDSFVIHFATEDRRINAYTLASTLIALADAAKAANSGVNAGHNIEIVVEALGGGSFRAQIRAVYSNARNLFSKDAIRTIVLGIISSFIYERMLSTHQDVKVEVQTTEVIVESGNERIIIPRQVYDATQMAASNPQFVGAIGRVMESVRRPIRWRLRDCSAHGLAGTGTTHPKRGIPTDCPEHEGRGKYTNH